MKRVLPLLLVVLFLSGVIITPQFSSSRIGAHNEITVLETKTPITGFFDSFIPLDRQVRIAIYDEPNITLPEYATGLGMQFSNEISALISLLEGEGFEVATLTVQDIANHELTTSDYDVLILADNYPRENITNYVDEFYFGGGGVLGLNAAIGYLAYSGIIFPEAKGDDLYGWFWDEEEWSTHKIIQRHPVTKDFEVDELIVDTTHTKKEFFNGSEIEEHSILAPYFEVIANQSDGMGVSSIGILDNAVNGTRVVTMMANTTTITSDVGELIVEAVEWLCPRPKGRVLYDLSHKPDYGLDEWDLDYVKYSVLQSLLRADMVQKGFTVDKLYPSVNGNLTGANLASYDVLIICQPDLNFTEQEIISVTDWISSGGSLVVIGDHSTTPVQNLNALLQHTNIKLNTTTGSNSLYQVGTHFVHEAAFTVSCLAPGSIEVSGSAVPVWDDGSGHVVVALDEYGAGKIVAVSDSAIFRDGRIEVDDNEAVATNLMNWLTGGDVLIFASAANSNSPNYPEPHRGPLATALRSLGIQYQLSSEMFYFNYSLVTQEWDMIIMDMEQGTIVSTPYYLNILDYLQSDGNAILSLWQMNTDSYPELTTLWDYVGVSYAGTEYIIPPTIYTWDSNHPIFNVPWDYNASNFTTSWNYVFRDAWNLTLYPNATAIAGLSPAQSSTNVSIALGAGGRVITNGMLVSAYSNDTDDSTYADSLELWMNEIAYMYPLTVDSPSDKTIELGSVGEKVTWSPSSNRPAKYVIERDSVEIVDSSWDGGSISVSLDGYLLGTYTFEVTVWNAFGTSATDSVLVTVEDTTAPTIVSVPSNLEYEEGVLQHQVNWTFSDLKPDSFEFYINSTLENTSSWDGSMLTENVGGLAPGVYNLTMAVNDTSNNWASSTVFLTVNASTSTTTSTTTTTSVTDTTDTGTGTPTTPDEGDITIIIILAAASAVIVIVIIILMKKKKS